MTQYFNIDINPETTIGDVWVSTVFLGSDHNWSNVGPPSVFETMYTVKGQFADFQARYATWDEAAAGHAEVVKLIEKGQRP